MATEAPREIGPYRLEEKLGAGGMGVVYKAVDTTLERIVAIKMMHARELLGDDVNLPEIQARFLREAKAAARIKSRHVAQVLQLGTTDDGEAYIVMEYLQGKALSRVITKGGQMPAARVVHIAKQLCRGMQSAHDLGVVHRDLKPANVMLVEEDGDKDFVKILDFGVAKLTNDTGAQGLTQTGALLGTLPFMAPEQISGQNIDARTDIYALGIILYRMFTGLSVWDADSLSDIVRHQLSSTPPSMFERVTNATFTPALDSAVLRCLAKDPAARWQSMRDVADALEAGLGDTSATTLRPPSSSSAPSSPGMNDPPSSSRAARGSNNPGTLPTGNGNSLAAIVTGQLNQPRDGDVFSDGNTMNAFAEAATATRAPAAVTRSLPGVPAPSSSNTSNPAPTPSRRLAAAPASNGSGVKIAVAAAVAIAVVVGAAVVFALVSAKTTPAPATATTPTTPSMPTPTPPPPPPPPPPPGTAVPVEVIEEPIAAPTPPSSTPPPTATTAPPPPAKPKVSKPKTEPVDDAGDDKAGFVRVRTKQEQ